MYRVYTGLFERLPKRAKSFSETRNCGTAGYKNSRKGLLSEREQAREALSLILIVKYLLKPRETAVFYCNKSVRLV